MRWIPFPFVRFAIAFISGILIGINFHPFLNEWIVTTSFWISLVAYFGLRTKGKESLKIWRGSIGLLALVCAGYSVVICRSENLQSNHLLKIKTKIEFLKVQLVQVPKMSSNTWNVVAEIQQIKTNTKWQSVQGKIQLLFDRKEFDQTYEYGDVLLLKGNPQFIQPPFNPGEFDYQKYLAFRNIFHQLFINSKNDVVLVNHEDGNLFIKYSYQARLWADHVLQINIKDDRALAIAQALILGLTDDLDDELLTAYSSTGVLHVLAVSGLHVGILYMIFLFFFKPIEKFKSGKWLIAILSVVMLWSYAFITGLSPSVLRAVTMFTCIAVSKPLNIRPNIYNTLSFSALIILLYDPFLIMAVGFQLSYLAVIGIVYFQPKFYEIWEPSSKVLDHVWKVISVSLAAQVSTFALSIYYFHQFPVYFLLANLIIIPCSFCVLVGGVALLGFQFVQSIGLFLGTVITALIQLMNFTVLSIEKLPFSLIQNIYLSDIQFLLLMLLISTIVIFAATRKFKYYFLGVIIMFMFSGFQWLHHLQFVKPDRFIVYRIQKHSAIDLFEKGKAFYLFDSTLSIQKKKIQFHILPNRIKSHIEQTEDMLQKEFVKSFQDGRLILWKGKYIFQITGNNFRVPSNFPFLEYCIISNNSVKDLITLKQQMNFKKIIIDSSNSFYFATELVKQSQIQQIDSYSVLHQGAFQVDL